MSDETPAPEGGTASDWGFETRMIHAGAGPDPVSGSRQIPIHQTSAYAFHDVDHAASL
ncbi:MAG: O-acetyl-L-homoserine sulfhydrolase, partial [Holophagales bacterium]|nr:O-acetyl-L-homoserine sulfhydrolase [Holophagales bacterium]